MKNLLILFSLLWVMSQSVSVLSCECPNCLNCSGYSQDYTEKKPCIACSKGDCIVCAVVTPLNKVTLSQEKMMVSSGATLVPIDRKKTPIETMQNMVLKDDLLSCDINWMDYYPHLKEEFKEYIKQMTSSHTDK